MQDGEKESNGMEVEVSPQQSIKYSEKLGRFQQAFQTFEQKMNTSSENLYFLVSCRFIQQWRKFCQKDTSKRVQPQPMNSDILDQNKKLIDGLIEDTDFKIVNKQIYDLFEGFSVIKQLRRISYGEGVNKKVPIYTTPIYYTTLSVADLKIFDSRNYQQSRLNPKTIESLSKQNTVLDLKKQIDEECMINNRYTTRLWYHQKLITVSIFYEHILKECKPLPDKDMKIRALGKLIQDQNMKIGEILGDSNSQSQQKDYFVLQQIFGERLVIFQNDEARCEGCGKTTKLKFSCGCKTTRYCTQQCLQLDKFSHSYRCKFLQEQQRTKPVVMQMKQNSRNGLVGLQNMGNTCFMNSCLQCLSHTIPLTQYFLSESYAAEINMNNPIGFKGKLAQAYAVFIKNMWCGSYSSYRPAQLKSAIAETNKIFSGYAQQDSQQLFSFLVDGLHQDMNRIKTKPYVESVDSNQRDDETVARESWLAYVQRNQSIITDIMMGLYKSKVTCPKCGKQSITFDPFSTISLPIPERKQLEAKFFVLYPDFIEKTIKISIRYKENRLDEIFQKISQILNKNKKEFELYILNFNEDIYSFETTPKSQILRKIQANYDTYCSNQPDLFVIMLSQQQINMQNRINIIFKFVKKSIIRNYQPIWFKRPFYFDYLNTTGLDMYIRILQNLYNKAYTYSEKRQQQRSQSKTISYKQYEKKMLEERPFKLVLKSQKKLKSGYLGINTQFKQQIQIQDAHNLKDLVSLQNLNDIQIDIRFTSKGLQIIDIDKLKDFQDKSKNSKKYQQDDDNKVITLGQCFQALQRPEQLQKGNQWYCPRCKQFQLATKQLSIYKVPQIMIIHLKRFKTRGNRGGRVKNQAMVKFPQKLNMQSYIVSKEPMLSYIPYIRSKQKYIEPSYKLEIPEQFSNVYELYAVSNHYGSMGGGHYTASAKNNQHWYNFNDSSVSKLSAIKGDSAYILFYRRIKNTIQNQNDL